MTAVYDRSEQLPEGFAAALPARAEPESLLLVSPEEFDVVDVRNPFMEGQAGKIDRAQAAAEWGEYRAVLDRETGGQVRVLAPRPGLVDMVFCQNQTLLGRRPDGTRLCLRSHMRLEPRRPEVAPVVGFFAEAGYDVADPLPAHLAFEGGGDATWHPGRRLLWGGYGPRSDRDAYPYVAQAFGVPVLRLELVDPRFYHLDTCFRPLDADTVLIYPGAFSDAGNDLIRAVFPSVVPVQEREAAETLALNGVALPRRKYVLHKGSPDLCAMLRALGYSVAEVRLGEFLKSGGSAYCMIKAFEAA